jgi:hypothetical protein
MCWKMLGHVSGNIIIFIIDLKIMQQYFFYDVVMLTCFTIPSGKCQSHGGTVSGICTE